MKRIIRLTESDLHKVINNSVKKVLREFSNDTEGYLDDDYYDTTTSVYKKVNKKIAEIAVRGNHGALASETGSLYGPGIYVVFEPRQEKAYDVPGQVWIEILIPGSAVKPMSNRHDGEFGIIKNPDDIYEVRYLDGMNG